MDNTSGSKMETCLLVHFMAVLPSVGTYHFLCYTECSVVVNLSSHSLDSTELSVAPSFVVYKRETDPHVNRIIKKKSSLRISLHLHTL